MAGDLKHECGTIGLIWVEIRGIWVSWSLGTGRGRRLCFHPAGRPGRLLRVLGAQPAMADLSGKFQWWVLWQLLPVSLWASLFPQTGTIFCVQLGSPDVSQALSCCSGTRTRTGSGPAFKVPSRCGQDGDSRTAAALVGWALVLAL